MAARVILVRKHGVEAFHRLERGLAGVYELDIVGSRCGPFEPALKLLSEGKIKLPPIELYDLKDFEKAFASRAFKAGFSFT